MDSNFTKVNLVRPKVDELRRAIPIIINALGREDLPVRQVGMGGSVEVCPKTRKPIAVNLPSIPDDASDKTVDACRGLLDHEAGHLKFTDFTLFKRLDGYDGQEFRNRSMCWNIFEDIYIEENMKGAYRGCSYTIFECWSLLGDEIILPKFEEEAAKPDVCKGTLVGIALPTIVRGLAGVKDSQETLKKLIEHPVVRTFASMIPKGIIDEAHSIRDSQHAFELGERLYAFLESISDPSECPESENKEENGGEDGKEGQSSAGGDEGESGSESGKQSEPDDEGEEESDGDDKGEEESDDEGKSDGDDEGEEDSDGDGKGEEDSDDEDDSPEEDHKEITGSVKHVTDDPDLSLTDQEQTQMFNNLKDADNLLEDIIKSSLKFDIQKTNYVPFTRDYDKIWDVKEHVKKFTRKRQWQEKELLDKLDQACEQHAGPIKRRLQRVIAARATSTYTLGHKSGPKINGAALCRVPANDFRVFKQKQENRTKFVDVMLVIDCSGSMTASSGGCSRVQLAYECAMVLADCLDSLDINNQVMTFTTRRDDIPRGVVEKINRSFDGDAPFSRYTPIEMVRIKPFGTKLLGQNREMFKQSLLTCNLSENVDGESIIYAAKELLSQNGHRKLMIVLSDGQPACGGSKSSHLNWHLKNAAKDIQKSGIELYGVGVQSDAVKMFYDDHSIVRTLEDLPLTVIQELERFIFKGFK